MMIDFPPNAKGLWVNQIIKQSRKILDAGCGPAGSSWWKRKPQYAEMVALDLFFTPKNLPPNTTAQKQDVLTYVYTPSIEGTFDLIVADHILEHINQPQDVAKGFNHILKPGGLLHVGVPDCEQFTDRFYRLIHADGGGHINQFTRDTLIALMEEAGFTCLAIRPWPESWDWLRNQYDWQAQGIQLTSQEDVEAIADVFQRELTLKKGYFYGWEAVFEKVQEVELPPPPVVPAGIEPEEDHTHPVRITDEEANDLQWLLRTARRVRSSRLYLAVKGFFKFLLPGGKNSAG